MVSPVARFMPVPGDVSVAEAGYVACLQAVGVSDTVGDIGCVGLPARPVLPSAAVGVGGDGLAQAQPVPVRHARAGEHGTFATAAPMTGTVG